MDESKSKYDERWSAECWWGKHVIVYGDAGLSRRHDVPRWLANEAKAASVSVYKDGIEAFARAYPSLTTASVRRNSGRSYPSQVGA